MIKNSQRGSAIIMLFIAVALFGLLAFAFLQGSRSNLSMMADESQKAQATQFRDCESTVQLTTKRLVARGCKASLISYEADGSNINSGAPTDGSCSVFHTNGGALKACGNYDPRCMLTLAAGESCAGVIYVGEWQSERHYIRPYDQGTTSWNNGTGPNTVAGAWELTDGVFNTDLLDTLVDGSAPYLGAEMCRALGPDWFLPARHTMLWLYTYRNLGDIAGTIQSAAYWTSSERDINRGELVDMSAGTQGAFPKGQANLVRCMRKDP